MVYGLNCFHFKGDTFVTIVILGAVVGGDGGMQLPDLSLQCFT
jgi:hypothetical protein